MPVESCVNVAASVTVAVGATLNLPPGCYKDVRVNAGGTLNLVAGLYNFKTLRLIAGATLNGGSVSDHRERAEPHHQRGRRELE